MSPRVRARRLAEERTGVLVPHRISASGMTLLADAPPGRQLKISVSRGHCRERKTLGIRD